MDHYRIIKGLGVGSFGTALLVEDDCDSKFVVKKISIRQMSERERDEARKEVEVLARMKHPNIIKYHKSFEEDGNLYIVTDFCDGGDLYTKISTQNGKPLTEDQILDWFVQICLAVKHVHSQKILHRDIKSQNIFLTKSGIAKLGDFGIARILSNTADLARTCIGTPYYLSPEMCENKPYNNKSDIWSLGCVLYEMATLQHPFEAKNMKKLVLKIVKGSYPPIPSFYSSDLRNLLNQMFRKNPLERPSINAIIRKPFIIQRICKFLNDSQMLDEFSHTFLHRNFQSNCCVKSSVCGEQKVKITEPAKKYGVSIASKKPRSSKNISRKNIGSKILQNNKECTNARDKQNNQANHYSIKKQQEEPTSGSKCDDSLPLMFIPPNLNQNSQVKRQTSEKSLKTKLLPTVINSNNNKKLEDSLHSRQSKLGNYIKTIIKNSDTFQQYLTDRNINEKNVENKLFELPKITKNSEINFHHPKCKWEIPSDADMLKNLPLEETASNMELTSSRDKVTLYQRRPHSAPISGRGRSRMGKSCKPFSPSDACQTDMGKLFPILDEDENLLSNTMKSCATRRKSNNDILEMKTPSNNSHHVKNPYSKDDSMVQNSVLSFGDNHKSGIDEVRTCREILLDIEGEDSETSLKSEVSKINQDDVTSCINELPKIFTHKLEEHYQPLSVHLSNEANSCVNEATNVDNIKRHKVESTNLILPQVDSLKTFLIQRNSDANANVLPVVSCENDTHSVINCDEAKRGNLPQSGIPESPVISHIQNVFTSTATSKPNETKVQIEKSVQCDLEAEELISFCSNTSEQSPSNSPYSSYNSSSVQNTEHSIIHYKVSSAVENKTEFDKQTFSRQHRSFSLPDLRSKYQFDDIKSQTDCRPLKNNGINTTADDSYKTAFEFEAIDDSDEEKDELYYVCQSMKEALKQTQKDLASSDILSTYSLAIFPTVDSPECDEFFKLEELKVDLERELGLKTFLAGYKVVKSIYESEETTPAECLDNISNILGLEYNLVYEKILKLVIGEDIYLCTKLETEETISTT